MKLTEGTKDMGLPEYIKFGLELEVENVNYVNMTKEAQARGWHTDKDMSLTDSGVETVSPPLHESDDKSVWEEVQEICDAIDRCPEDKSRPSYTDHTCGGHVHFDASIFRENPEMMKNFLRLWAESEELVYKMCNDKSDPITSGAIESPHTTLIDVCKTLFQNPIPETDNKVPLSKRPIKEYAKIISGTAKNIKNNFTNANRKLNSVLTDAFGLTKNGMAAPISSKIKKQLMNGKLKLGKPKSAFYRRTIVKNKFTPERFSGLNLTNIGSKDKDTIEFRMSNGTKDPRVLKENVFLYASLIQAAERMTNEPERMQEKLQEFYRTDLSEEEKVDAFLNLIIDDKDDRQVYKDRWESVKDEPVFAKAQEKFADGTFRRENIAPVVRQAKGSKVKEAFNNLSQMLKDFSRDGREGAIVEPSR